MIYSNKYKIYETINNNINKPSEIRNQLINLHISSMAATSLLPDSINSPALSPV